MVNINIATPRAILHGVKDESIRQLLPEDVKDSQVLPFILLLTEKGPDLAYVNGTSKDKVFGKDSFDLNGKFTTHQTTAAVETFTSGNPALIKRIKPAQSATADGGLYAETISAKVGTQIVNRVFYSEEVPVGTVFTRGEKLKFRLGKTKLKPTDPNKSAIGWLRKDGSNDIYAADSNLYKLLTFKAYSFGEHYNRYSVRIMARANKRNDVTAMQMSQQVGHYVYSLQVISKNPATGKSLIVPSKYGDDITYAVLAEDVSNPVSGESLSIDDALLENFPDVFSEVKADWDGIDKFLTRLKGDRTEEDTSGTSYTVPDSGIEKGLMNIVNDVAVDNSVIETTAIQLTPTNLNRGIALKGGSDGIPNIGEEVDGIRVSRAVRSVVTNMMLEYALISEAEAIQSDVSWLADELAYPVRNLVDTGFSLYNKDNLAVFAGLRKDINVDLTTFQMLYNFDPATHKPEVPTAAEQTALLNAWKAEGHSDEEANQLLTEKINSGAPTNVSTFDLGLLGKTLTRGEETAMVTAIKQKVALYIESERYGTPAMRITIMQGSGKNRITDTYPYPQPLLIEVFGKNALYMAGPDWKSGLAPDASPRNIIESFRSRDINVIFKAGSHRDVDWQNGSYWVESYDTSRVFVPAQRTIYPEQTSVLTSRFTSVACATAEVVCRTVWRDLVGNGKLTADQFLERSDEMIAERLNGRFDNRYIIEAKTVYTEADKRRGYSWTTTIFIYADNMKTVGQYTVVSRRREDYIAGGNN